MTLFYGPWLILYWNDQLQAPVNAFFCPIPSLDWDFFVPILPIISGKCIQASNSWYWLFLPGFGNKKASFKYIALVLQIFWAVPSDWCQLWLWLWYLSNGQYACWWISQDFVYAMYIQNDALENTSLLEELFDPNEVPFHTEFLLAFFFFLIPGRECTNTGSL